MRKTTGKKEPMIFLKAYNLDDSGNLKSISDIKTPIKYVEDIEDFKENLFWINIKNIWVLVGRIPPLELKQGDLLLSKDKNRWGIYRYIGEEENKMILQDGEGKRKSKVDKEKVRELKFFGKVIMVSNKVNLKV